MKLRWNQRWSKDKPSEKPGKQPGAGWATWLTLVGQHLVGQFHRLAPQPAVFLGSPELQSRLVRTCGATSKNTSLVHFERWQIGEILKLFDIWADFNPGPSWNVWPPWTWILKHCLLVSATSWALMVTFIILVHWLISLFNLILVGHSLYHCVGFQVLGKVYWKH